MSYFFLKFIHIVGFILLGGGLIGVFTADLRSRQIHDIKIIAEACRYVAIFYDGVVVPGAVLVGVSGLLLTLKIKFGFLGSPWLAGMWMLFVFEFIEGNTITRIHFRRMLRLSRDALTRGIITEGLRLEQAKRLPTFTHFLDLPLFLLIVTFGGLRPSSWGFVAAGVILAVSVGAMLAFILTRIYKIQ